jgi:cellulose synthase/poly-beta-1,6-N-acetylglucosamine synthase-like glycosyltransferase
MMEIAAAVAWIALGGVVYVYAGYPALLWLATRLCSRPVRRDGITPPVTLVISAFNEGRVIGSKIENSLQLDYPGDRLEIVVVSDASTDDTDAIVRSFADRGVCLLRLSERAGKTAGLNQALRLATNDIIVFSDANILYARTAIRCLVRGFADARVGCITGDSRYVGESSSSAHVQESSYWSYERLVREMESRLGSTVGGDGAIFAIRRHLYTPLAPEAINDLVTPLQIVAKGYRAVFDPDAVGYEASAGSYRAEFRRKRRIVARSWRGVMSVPGVLRPWRTGVFAWQVWSHKVLRWLVLPLVVVAVGASLVAAPSGRLYETIVLGFLSSVALAGIGATVGDRLGRLAPLTHAALYFYLVNCAAVLGVGMALVGRSDVVWASQRN